MKDDTLSVYLSILGLLILSISVGAAYNPAAGGIFFGAALLWYVWFWRNG